MILHENLMAQQATADADFFAERYPDQIKALCEDSPLAKIRGVTPLDVQNVGQQLLMFESYVNYVNEIGTSADLGTLPNIALDIITGSYGASIIPLIASTQNLQEERGLVYFKTFRAENTRGNVTAGQTIRDPRSATQAYQQGYAGEIIGPEAVSSTTAGTMTYNIGLGFSPVRPKTLKLTIPALGIEAVDNGEGRLLGINCQGTINYATGAIVLQLQNVTPVTGDDIICEWGTDFEIDGNVPRMNIVIDSIDVKAEIFALRGQTGLFKNFAMRKRFGKMADQEMVNDLTNELTAELNYKATNLYLANAQGETAFNPKPADGVSFFEHKQEFLDKISQAEVSILDRAGKGRVNVFLCGTEVCSLFSNMPKFVRSNIDSDGPHVYGSYDGMTVIRCPQFPRLEAVALYRGPGMFDTGLVYAPYMPLFIGSTIPSPDNILMNEAVAAIWVAFKMVVANYCTKVRLTQPLSASSGA